MNSPLQKSIGQKTAPFIVLRLVPHVRCEDSKTSDGRCTYDSSGTHLTSPTSGTINVHSSSGDGGITNSPSWLENPAWSSRTRPHAVLQSHVSVQFKKATDISDVLILPGISNVNRTHSFPSAPVLFLTLLSTSFSSYRRRTSGTRASAMFRGVLPGILGFFLLLFAMTGFLNGSTYCMIGIISEFTYQTRGPALGWTAAIAA